MLPSLAQLGDIDWVPQRMGLGQQMVRKIAIRVTHAVGLNIAEPKGRGDPAALRARKLPLPASC
jgi:hypothetical protein